MSKLSYESIIKRAKTNADCGEHLSPAEVTELVLAFETQVKQLAADNAAILQDRSVILEAFDSTCVDIGMRRGEMAEQYPCPVVSNTEAILASLRAERAANAIPIGYVLMPEQIHLDADAVECICSQGGDGGYNYGDFTDVILWVGEVESDDGSKTHGLNVSSADYPEDWAINLYEFAAQLRSQSAPSPRVAATPETAAIARMFEQVKAVQHD
ncbi:hypothetical protein LCF16_003987 [Salmonella enterica]|nr:hypothetical protein [Salmonella enterica]